MSLLLNAIPWWGRILAIAALGCALWGHGYVHGLEHEREKNGAAEAAAVTAAYHIVTKHEVQYVDRIQNIAGPPVVHERLVSLCADAGHVVPGQPAAAASAPANADDGSLDGLAADLTASAANKAQCEELIGAISDINAGRR